MKRKLEANDSSEAKKIKTETNHAAQNTNNNIINTQQRCPYLHTINRQALEFDLEKVCSVTLSTQNIYCCLVCGKYFKGRGVHTPCHTHSVQASHYLFINLETGEIYCIPDNYQIKDVSLNDIRYNLNPTFAEKEVTTIGRQMTHYKDIFGGKYLPGFVGMNQVCKTDYINVIVYLLAHVKEARSFFLRNKNQPIVKENHLLNSFAELLSNLWNHKKFKSSVNPHKFVHMVAVESNKRFDINQREDAKDFLIWLLNTLSLTLNKQLARNKAQKNPGAKGAAKLVASLFQGKLEIHKRSKRFLSLKKSPFMFLSLDLPEFPLFTDLDNKEVDFNQSLLLQTQRRREQMSLIPEIDLAELLKKFKYVNEKLETVNDEPEESQVAAGVKGSIKNINIIVENGKVIKRRYKLLKAPKYLLLHVNRFVKNNWNLEKNPTVLNFPIDDLDLTDYFHKKEYFEEEENLEEIRLLRRDELVHLARKHDVQEIEQKGREELSREIKAVLQRRTLQEKLGEQATKPRKGTQSKNNESQSHSEQKIVYDLIANVSHESPPTQGKQQKRTEIDPLRQGRYKIQLRNLAVDNLKKVWFEFEGLQVKEVMPQQIGNSEAYILLYKKRKPVSKNSRG